VGRVKIGSLEAPGFIADAAPYTIPVEAFSEARNVRFTPNGAVSFGGDEEVFSTAPITPLWIKPFPPVTAPLWVYAGLTKVYAYDGSHNEITRASGLYSATATERWHGEVLNGIGFLNNTIDVPQMWTDFDASTVLQDLSNWPSTVRCKFMRPFKFFMFAGYTIESGSERPFRIRWSHPAAPGTVPSSWALNDPTKDSGEIDIAETDDYLVDGLALGDLFIVYKQKTTHAMQFVGRPNIFSRWPILSTKGLLWRDCVQSFPGGHFVAGIDDLYVHNGQRDSDVSLVEGKLRNWIFNQIDTENYQNCFTLNYERRGEIWFCFPEAGSTYATLAAVWNRDKGGIGIRDLFHSPFIYSGPKLVPTGGSGIWDDA